MSETYQVRHKASGASWYVVAGSSHEAIERVTLALDDPEGKHAWDAAPGESAHPIRDGMVLDSAGKSLEA